MDSIAHVLLGLAIGECLLACVLTLGVCACWPFIRPAYADRARKKSLAEGWRFVVLVKFVAYFCLCFGYVFNFLHSKVWDEQIWAVLTAMSLASFGALEIFGVWKAWRAVRTYSGLGRLCVSIGSLLLLMEMLGATAIYHLCDYVEWWRCELLPFDPLFVLTVFWAIVFTCGILTRFVMNSIRWRYMRSGAVACAVWCFFFMFAAYAALVPLQGRYLAAMLCRESLLNTTSASYTRILSMTKLAPYLNSEVFEDLPARVWGWVTVRNERLNDPIFMAQLRRAAREETYGDELSRLWVLDPLTARRVAEDLINEEKYTCYCDDPAVLFLENPDCPVFKEFIPDDPKRRELSALLFRWSAGSIAEALKTWRVTDLIYHRISIGYSRIRWDMTYYAEEKKAWFRCGNETMPESLIPSAIDFLVFTRDDSAYGLMSCPTTKYAVLAMRAFLENERRVHNPYGPTLRMDYFLKNVNRDVAIACVRAAVETYGEKAFMNLWLNHPFLDDWQCTSKAQYILDRWNEVVPGAPTLNGAKGKAAIDLFLAARIAKLNGG
jgi:hypothetical protein